MTSTSRCRGGVQASPGSQAAPEPVDDLRAIANRAGGLVGHADPEAAAMGETVAELVEDVLDEAVALSMEQLLLARPVQQRAQTQGNPHGCPLVAELPSTACMASTTAEGRVDRVEAGRWQHALGPVPTDQGNHLAVERDEALAQCLLQDDAGQVLDHGEVVVAEHAIRVQRPQALEAAPRALGNGWDEIGRRDGTLLELRGALWGEPARG